MTNWDNISWYLIIKILLLRTYCHYNGLEIFQAKKKCYNSRAAWITTVLHNSLYFLCWFKSLLPWPSSWWSWNRLAWRTCSYADDTSARTSQVFVCSWTPAPPCHLTLFSPRPACSPVPSALLKAPPTGFSLNVQYIKLSHLYNSNLFLMHIMNRLNCSLK